MQIGVAGALQSMTPSHVLMSTIWLFATVTSGGLLMSGSSTLSSRVPAFQT